MQTNSQSRRSRPASGSVKRIKRFAKRSLLLARYPLASMRALPDFLIIGAQKAGTTSLSEYLGQHPDIACALGKEVHYFDLDRAWAQSAQSGNKRWYRCHFPTRRLRPTRQLCFESTPMYLFHPHAASRIQSVLPDARLIVLLRNPTDRAVSHYHHSCSRGHEPLELEAALLAEEERIGRFLADEDFSEPAVRYFSYKSRGHYAAQLKRYLDLFPQQKVLILSSEEMFSTPAVAMRRTTEFLGMDADLGRYDFAPRNVAVRRAATPGSVREYLDDYFREPNEQLYELLGRDLGWHRQDTATSG